MVNKFNLLLHALVATHDREFEIMTHLQTKRKILLILNNFVNMDAEMSVKLTVTEDKSDEDLQQGMVLDFHKEENKDADVGKGQQGLSIEEMNVRTIRDTLLQQKNKYVHIISHLIWNNLR